VILASARDCVCCQWLSVLAVAHGYGSEDSELGGQSQLFLSFARQTGFKHSGNVQARFEKAEVSRSDYVKAKL